MGNPIPLIEWMLYWKTLIISLWTYNIEIEYLKWSPKGSPLWSLESVNIVRHHSHDCVLWYGTVDLKVQRLCRCTFFLPTWALKAEQFVQLIVEKKVREIQSVSRTPGSPAGAEMESLMTRDAGGLRNRVDLDWQPARKCEHQSYSHRNWIILTTWTPLEADSPLECPLKSPGQKTPWFLLCTPLSKRRSWACMKFWPTEPRNKWMLF